MRYVSCMGAIYKMNNRTYKRLLEAIASQDEVDPNDYGKCVASNITDITDMDQEEVRWRLVAENAK